MRHLFTLLTASSLLLTACGPEGVGQGFSTQEPQMIVKNTAPEGVKTQVQKNANLDIILGATKNNNLAVSYATDVRRMVLRGELELTPVGTNRKPIFIPIDLAGLADNEGYVYLKEYDTKSAKAPDVRLGAKATCLGEDLNCATSFIDIYIEFEGHIYRHQLESAPAATVTPDVPSTPGHQPNPPQKSHELSPVFEEEEDESDSSTESHYVGNPLDDIEKILGIKATPPQAPPKKDPPKKEAPPKAPTPTPTPPKGSDKGDKDDDDQETKTSSPFSETNQAVGSVNAGRLEKGINLYEVQTSMADSGFKILRPKNAAYFGTSEMAAIIVMMGEQTKTLVPGGYLGIGDISTAKGGRLSGHKSHTNGLDADVAYFFKKKSFLGSFTSAVVGDKKGSKTHEDWMVDEQWQLFKNIVRTQMVDRIFVHSVLKKAFCDAAIKSGELKKDTNSLAAETLRRLNLEPGHGNHFHLRLKCSKAQPRCRQMTEPPVGSGCF